MKRVIIRDFVNGEAKPLAEIGLEGAKIKRVWTVIHEDLLIPKFNPQTGERIDPPTATLDIATPIHGYNAFLEDIIHDWKVIDGRFRFYGHSGSKGSLHDLLIEYL